MEEECSSCGNLHTKDCGCSKGSLEDKILILIPDLSQQPLKIKKICLDCGNPVHGLYSRQCALIQKTLEEVFLDFQDTSKSSDDDTNFVNQEPFVVKQGPGVNSSQSPPHIKHNCCYECGDSIDDIFSQRCTCESCGKGGHYGYNCPPQVPIISKPEPCYNQTVNEFPQTLPSVHLTSCSGDENSFTYDSKPNYVDNSPNVFNPPP
ncbi:putative reverse transcriptase domain-containing protein [Tanacetum coccineum]